MSAINEVIFNGKTLSDMFADVYRNTDAKRTQINSLIASAVKLIRSPDDVAVLGPVIKDFLDVNVRNDEHIVRLVQIAQRIVSTNGKKEDGSLLTDAEKLQLIGNVKLEFESILEEQETMQDKLDNMEK